MCSCGRAASREASSEAASGSSSGRTTLCTSPIPAAKVASSRMLVADICRACEMPMLRGSKNDVPLSGVSPSDSYEVRNIERSDASCISAAKASPSPPPAATPSTAAMMTALSSASLMSASWNVPASCRTLGAEVARLRHLNNIAARAKSATSTADDRHTGPCC